MPKLKVFLLQLLLLLPLLVSNVYGENEQFKYSEIGTGQLKGKLIVQWLEPDVFLFLPDKNDPLTFIRANGESVTPGKMLTDGGSIPRPIWVLRNYSPWGFAPAFIVHDWLFEVKHCQIDGYENWTLPEAGFVMAEVMKTMISSGDIEAGPLTVHSMYLAVVSPPAKKSWENGRCNPPPIGAFQGKPILEFELNFNLNGN